MDNFIFIFMRTRLRNDASHCILLLRKCSSDKKKKTILPAHSFKKYSQPRSSLKHSAFVTKFPFV